MREHRVSSPAATGGAGTFFEQHVAAYWLAQLLVRGRPPILHDCSVVEVHLQTEHLGWHTDDFLIIGLDDAQSQRRLAGQVKRTFTISTADEQCRKTIGDLWNDFKSDGPFSLTTDRFALVVQRGTKNLLDHFIRLLDCARAASDDADFAHRLKTPGFVSKQAVSYCSDLCTIIGEIEGSSITPMKIWSFLRILYVLNLDLATSTRQMEAHIKTLLEYAYTDFGALESPDASWNELLVLASNAMADACSFTRDRLPDSLKQRYSVFGMREERVLRALKDHSNIILNGIRSNIGNDFHLPRAGLVHKILECLESTQVALVSGPAGSGKSVIAKSAIGTLTQDYFVFSFRAEELAQPHLDAALQNSQIPVRSAALNAILASQDRKVLLIESVERLLEKSTRDAFSDLLRLVAADRTLRVVLTCRDYSVDLVHSIVLMPAGIEPSIIGIPSLDDTELAEVETALPALARPLGNRKLRQILRNPYFLDKALQISWTADRSLPESERELRAVFWRQIVRADDRLSAGMPHRREDTFQKIAVRRARALTAYIPCFDLDPAVVDSLRHDSLVASPSQDQSALRVAPAHDVLEDWAILHWIEEQYVGSENDFHALSEAIGTHPAIRRAYRKWVAELIDRDPVAADRLFNAAIADSGILIQFRDDTLVSLLRAPSSRTFLERHVSELLADGRDLLIRVIRLLRVACMTTPEWLPDSAANRSLWTNVPTGTAWASILRIVQNHIGTFTASELPLLLDLISDWARGVSSWEPYPDGAESVVSIAHWLLPCFDGYRSEDAHRQVLNVIAKIPKADATRFESLLLSNVESGKRDRTADTFRDIIFSEMEGMPAARDLPDILVSAASEYLICTETDLEQCSDYDLHELEILFGLKKHLAHKFFPASAYRGPWIHLLKCHMRKGLDFFITLFNHSADWYAHPRISDRLEPPFEIELVFPDGSYQIQWINSRLWNLYRGTSVGPYVLQSMLMALERWLLDFAKTRPEELDAILLDILRRSSSAALTSVVAGVATAFPHLSGESLLVLLTSHACIRLDLRRTMMESQGALIGFDRYRVESRIYEMERKEMHALAHRRHHLESAILNLQLGPFASRVHEILDQHREALPQASEQTEDDRIWRLSIHRMDLRRYSVTEATTGPDSSTEATSADPARSQILLNPKDPEPDIKAMMEESATKFDVTSAGIGLLMWALHIFEKRSAETYDPGEWRQRLNQARTTEGTITEDEGVDLYRGGPGIVAAVCARDHWQEMSCDEQNWCVEIVCSEVARHADVWSHLARVQQNNMSADRSCAVVVSFLVGKPLSEIQRLHVRQALVTALTHSIDEVKRYAAQGVAEHLWSIDHTLAMRCVYALATEATLVDQMRSKEAEHPYDQCRQIDDLSAEAATIIRRRFWSDGISDNAYQELDIRRGFGARANVLILTMLSQVPTDPLAIAAFTRTAHTLVEWWDSDDERKYQRNYNIEFTMVEFLSNFSMRTSDDVVGTVLQPLLDAVDRHPRDIHWIVQNLVGIEDRCPNTPRFWVVWKLFADSIRRAGWLTRLDDHEYPIGNELLPVIFLGTNWKENVRHWRSIEGYADYVHALFEDLSPSSAVLDAYVRFLFHIGEQSLPNAFVRVADCLRLGDVRKMLRKTNTIFMLEVLLQRYVYGRPLELKRERPIREAVLFLLDTLVEQGSSGAFRMRDDFVTPIPTA